MPRRISLLIALALAASAAPAHAAQPFSTDVPGGTAAAATVADVDRDGRQDLVVAGDGYLTVHTHRADGGFTPGRPHRISSSPVQAIHVADLDGDRREDILVHAGIELRLLHARADGSFDSSVVYHLSENVAVADVSGDGNPDIVHSMVWPQGVRVGSLRTDGTIAWTGHGAFAQTPRDVVAGDLDGDGHDDVLTFHYSDESASLLPGSSAGLGAARHWGSLAYGRAPLIRDLDGDGSGDLALIRNEHVIVHRRADWSQAPRETWLRLGGPGELLRAADLDGDGRLDLAALTGRGVTLLKGLPGGQFAAPVSVATGEGHRSALAFGDLDGDGRTDAVHSIDGGVRVLYQPPPTVALSAPTAGDGSPFTVTAALPGFQPSVHSVQRFVKGPKDADFRPLSDDVVDPADGDGEYRLRAVAYDLNGHPLTTAETVTTVAAPASLPEPAPEPRVDTLAVQVELPGPGPAPLSPRTRVPAPAPAPARLRFDVRSPGKTSTRLLLLRIESVLPGTTITVRCARGCPVQRYTKRKASGTVSLARFVTRPLKAGTTIKITLAEPGAQPVLATIKIRSRRPPSVTTKLVPL